MKKTVIHERFKCEECGERLETKNCLTNHMISEHKQPGEVFKCGDCNFSTSRKMGVMIHKSRKHDAIDILLSFIDLVWDCTIVTYKRKTPNKTITMGQHQ